MSVKVVARIRPLLKTELEKDSILECAASSPSDTAGRPSVVRLPNPRNPSESFSFQFNSVYNQDATQQEVFENEISPSVKHLFNGFDITIFAYGVTGSGKTHTMRGGKSLGDRGVIPRLLSGIYRRGRKVEKENDGNTSVEVSMSYYEIYNDRVYDLFEPPEKRTATGLPIRDHNGKSVVAGLTERPCTTLKEFEQLYDSANVNRSTSATKLNAHSSRSHAILSVKISQIHPTHTITSTASAIDLAGSEDNRRTGNDKERLVESSSINKSLFVLAQCVEAIAKKQSRIPYRESKMTRILSLGQNQGLTIMILNLAPVRSYHLDTLSSLNFANRTKKIEVREVENEPVVRGLTKISTGPTIVGPSIQRPPLRPIAANVALAYTTSGPQNKPTKAFTVYSERTSLSKGASFRTSDALKRSADTIQSSRPSKIQRTSTDACARPRDPELTRSDLEVLINQLVDEKLANRAMEPSLPGLNPAQLPPAPLSTELQHRLEALEKRISRKEDERAEGLQFLLMAKQHQAHGEDASALKMYQLALPFFPGNEKLAQRMLALQEKLWAKPAESGTEMISTTADAAAGPPRGRKKRDSDGEYHEQDPSSEHAVSSHDELSPTATRPRAKKAKRPAKPAIRLDVFRDNDPFGPGQPLDTDHVNTPRTTHLLRVINSRDVAQIRALKGLGAKRAEVVLSYVSGLDAEAGEGDGVEVRSLRQLEALKGLGGRTLEAMRAGVVLSI